MPADERDRYLTAAYDGDHEQEWQTAVADIATRDAYHGLQLAPQIGLVPLGRDPAPGLWEFWHVASGTRPSRDAAVETLQMTVDSGIVLVLLPGGSSWIGSQIERPDAPHYDRFARPIEPP